MYQRFAPQGSPWRSPSSSLCLCLALGLPLAAVSLIGYSAMVGAVGGGGLGDLGIRYGYQRFLPDVMAAVVMVLIVMVQLVQSGGDLLARHVDKRNLKS